jgi:hypothetical protein
MTATGRSSTVWNIDVRSVSLGSTFLGLAWTSTALMLVGTSVWELAERKGGNEIETTEMKEDRYVQR